MNCTFHHQSETSLISVLNRISKDYSNICIAVAYLTKDGLEKIEPHLILKQNVKLICGIHGSISDLFALNSLVKKSNKIEGHVFIGKEIFHSKIYIFIENESSCIIVGSPNLTIGGFERNEETFVEITGSLNEQPIHNIISYFENLWEKYSAPVGYYLERHKDYKVNLNENENLSSRQIDILKEYQKILDRKHLLKFDKKIGQEIYKNGRVTIPKKFDEILDDLNYCPLGSSRTIKVYSNLSEKLIGRFYQSWNNSTSYYQFYLTNNSDKKKFREFVEGESYLNFSFNLINHTIIVKKK